MQLRVRFRDRHRTRRGARLDRARAIEASRVAPGSSSLWRSSLGPVPVATARDPRARLVRAPVADRSPQIASGRGRATLFSTAQVDRWRLFCRGLADVTFFLRVADDTLDARGVGTTHRTIAIQHRDASRRRRPSHPCITRNGVYSIDSSRPKLRSIVAQNRNSSRKSAR